MINSTGPGGFKPDFLPKLITERYFFGQEDSQWYMVPERLRKVWERYHDRYEEPVPEDCGELLKDVIRAQNRMAKEQFREYFLGYRIDNESISHITFEKPEGA